MFFFAINVILPSKDSCSPRLSSEDAAPLSENASCHSNVSSTYLRACCTHDRRVKFSRKPTQIAKSQEKEFPFMSELIRERSTCLKQDMMPRPYRRPNKKPEEKLVTFMRAYIQIKRTNQDSMRRLMLSQIKGVLQKIHAFVN